MSKYVLHFLDSTGVVHIGGMDSTDESVARKKYKRAFRRTFGVDPVERPMRLIGITTADYKRVVFDSGDHGLNLPWFSKPIGE